MEKTKKAEARFDARLPREKKELFERAARLGGYKNLTDFVMGSAQDRARQIIEEHGQLLASRRDGKVFWDAITQAAKPNKHLLEAARHHESSLPR